MTTKRTENGFPHSPDPIEGVDAKTTLHPNGDVTVAFGDGSDSLKVDRREFMRLSGVAAATVAMTTTACRNPVEQIVPYVDRPEQIRMGRSNYYATVCTGCSAQCGALVQTRGGRPIKLEGNPNHPGNRGALCARGQASYRTLYDPDRAKTPLEVFKNGNHRPVEWKDIDAAMIAAIKTAANGGGIGLLTETLSGEARGALIQEIQRTVPTFRHYEYEALASEATLEANAAAYGIKGLPHYRFDRADLVVSLGSDFLGTWLSPVEFSKQFASRRNPDGAFNKLIAFEGHLSITGMNADERYRVRPSDMHVVAMGLAHVVIAVRGMNNSPALLAAVNPFTPQAVSDATGLPADVITAAGQALADAGGKSLVVAGGAASATSNGLHLELAVNLLNSALGNDGNTIERTRPSRQAMGGFSKLQQLVADIDAGKIDVLIIDSVNPIYSAPPELNLGAALDKVKLVVSTSDRVDETGAHAKYLAPAGTSLETWGDSSPYLGVYSIQQPSVSPIHATRGLETSLIQWFAETVPSLATYLEAPAPPLGNFPGAGPNTDAGPWFRYLRAYWERVIYPRAKSVASFDTFWDDTLRKGVFIVTLPGLPEPKFNQRALGLLPRQAPAARSIPIEDLSKKEIQLVTIAAMHDGRFANEGHLQELPDPVTKHVWGSFVAVSPKTFVACKLEQGQYIEFNVNGETQRYPVIMQPGLHDDVIAVPVGYGRTSSGVIGDGVGQNAFKMTRIADLVPNKKTQVFDPQGIEVKSVRDGEQIAIEQGAQVLDNHRRPILATTTLKEYKADPASGIHAHPPLLDMWAAHKYEKTKWGMSIDLTKCTGCSACVIACQEENNVPVVGRQGVLEGRIMHWMRVDRYYLVGHETEKLQADYKNDPMMEAQPVVALAEFMDTPPVVNQPMLCQHCENAPCETVCPVSATMHSAEGLNQMAYNRCVGTRYCANNCPFKVRRFNWFNYVTDRENSVFARLYPELKDHARLNAKPPMNLAFNPDVTIRARGVMEKCTFCVQRIRQSATELRKQGRDDFKDGDVTPACQQSCPSDAIVFGNLVDKGSAVAKLHQTPRAVSPLAEIGVGSSVAYLSVVRNHEPKAHDAGHDGDHDSASDHG